MTFLLCLPSYFVLNVLAGLREDFPKVLRALLSFQSLAAVVLAAFGPITFMICVLGGLGNMIGAFFAAFIIAQVISLGGVLISTEMGYVIAFVIFIVLMFVRPGGIFARRA